MGSPPGAEPLDDDELAELFFLAGQSDGDTRLLLEQLLRRLLHLEADVARLEEQQLRASKTVRVVGSLLADNLAPQE